MSSAEEYTTEQEKAALAARIRRRLLLLRSLRFAGRLLASVLSLLLLLPVLAGPYWNPTCAFMYELLPLHPARALCVWCSPDLCIDGELAYDVYFADMLLFYGALLIAPWCYLCARCTWLPISLLSLAALRLLFF